MIKVKVNDDKIIITGHAGFDEYGKDIVCASVSSIIITTVNGIMKLNSKVIDFNQEQDKLEIKILKHSKESDILIENMLDLLEELELKYNKNIKIIK